MQVSFIGDTHFGHKNAIKWRDQFATPEEHDSHIFNNIMSMSGKRSRLYVMGDFVLKNDAFHYAERIVESFDKIILVLGNHDLEREDSPTVSDLISLGIDIVGFQKYKEFWLSHCPIHPDELRGKANIHGHVHSNTIVSPEYFNTSCENINFKPITLEEIRAIMASRNNSV